MDYIVVGLIVLAVVGFLAFKNKDKILGKLKGAAPMPAAAPSAPLPAGTVPFINRAPVSIDYDYWKQWTRYDLETLQFMLHGGKPAGWDWSKHEAARGDPDGSTHSNTGAAITPQESRQYVDNAVADGDYCDVLVNLPGSLTIRRATQPLELTVMHGRASHGLIYTTVDGGVPSGEILVPVGPGDHLITFRGEPGAGFRATVVARPAPKTAA